MGRWSQDDDEAEVFGAPLTWRTCDGCKQLFRLMVAGEYQLHVLCDQCLRNQAAQRAQAAEARLKGVG